MRIWRIGNDFLVERDVGNFWLVDESGAITKRFEPTTWSIEDELGKSTYFVDDALRNRIEVERWSFEPRVEIRPELVNLVADDDPETQRFIGEVLGDEAVSREAERLRLARDGEARITAIAGARRDHGLGEDFSRAQHALCEHVRAYHDELYDALLRTLIALARARANPSAIREYTRACLLACFAHEVPQRVAGDVVAMPGLVEQLAARAEELEQRALGQEYVDANLNASQYRAAAAAVRMAAQLLGG